MNNTVLVIDDALPVHRIIQAHLRPEFDCLSAFDGNKGIAMAQSENPDLILLDIDLPSGDGFDVYKKLRQCARTAQIPVIFLTADFNTSDKVRALELGAVDYITKPCNFDELSARVKRAIRARNQMDQRAMRDSLTGLWNLAYMQGQLPSRIAMARHAGQALSCIVIDIDNLNAINERHGRRVGDEVVRTVGRILSGQCRAEDLLCAMGKGKFALSSFGIDRHGASRIATRFRQMCLRELRVVNGARLDATCSFGVADIEVAEKYSLLDRARAVVRRAKDNGCENISVARPNRTNELLAA